LTLNLLVHGISFFTEEENAMKSIVGILSPLSMILLPIATVVGVQALLTPTAHAQSNDKRCATLSCKEELDKVEKEQGNTRLQIQDVDIKIARIGKQQDLIKSSRATLERDIAQYRLECTGITVETASQQAELEGKCKLRKQVLEHKTEKQDDDERTMPNWSWQLTSAAIKKDQLQSSEKRLESRKVELSSQAIVAVLGDLQSRQSASKACQSLEDTEQLRCCHSVVWDGVAPAQCGVKLLYTLFYRMGVFSGNSVVPH
jgi:hypothetical protein